MEEPKATREDFELEDKISREGKKIGIYRSKLEQSWAMFFVEYGIPFIHEPRYYYEWLPDFELPDCRALIEVKPTLEIAKGEVPRYYAGMKWAFYNEKRDIVLLVGRPEIDDYGASDNICGFADKTYVGKKAGLYEVQGDWSRDFYSGAGDAQFVQCKRCEAYFFIGLGNWSCRRCDYYDGDQGFDTIFSRSFKQTMKREQVKGEDKAALPGGSKDLPLDF